MKEYVPTIGLEIHAELKTKTKMFCQSKNEPHASNANTHICPVCMAFPGTLPVINKSAVHHVLRVGAALGGVLADYTEFDRKNYFYPDLPKGYQISQYKYPLVSQGSLRGIQITRIHLEEDTARSQHEGDSSLIDYNRAGVPLMELVTEPVIHEAKHAAQFAQELQILLRTLGASDANMEKGEMRVEANISVSQDTAQLGTKVEVKNLNSFKSVEKAIDFEIKRHIEALKKGERLVQETRGWDENKQITFSQRLKENSMDYRYFPDPDLPKLYISKVEDFSLKNILKSLPELPWNKRIRYSSYGLQEQDVEVFVYDEKFSVFFDNEIIKNTKDEKFIKIAANYLLSEVRGENAIRGLQVLSGGVFFELVTMLYKKEISSRGGKDVLEALLETGGNPRDIAKNRGLIQVHDPNVLLEYAKAVIIENPIVVADFKEGKEVALKFLVGQGMKKSKGSANPEELSLLIKKELGL